MFSSNFETTVGANTEKSKIEQWLVYLGQNGTSFTLGYREMIDGRMRDSFREDAQYQNPTKQEATEIAFGKARLRVHAVSNTGIEYEVLSEQDQI